MTRRKNSLLALIAVLLMPVMANADPITFMLETTLDDGSNAGTFQGYITLDSADVFAFNTVSASDFLDWAFSWGTESIAAGGSGGFTAGSFITFDAFPQITTWAICATTPPGCLATQDPGFFSDSSGNLNFATADGQGEFNFPVEQIWTRVPEPGTLALLGIGLLGMGLARRRKS